MEVRVTVSIVLLLDHLFVVVKYLAPTYLNDAEAQDGRSDVTDPHTGESCDSHACE
jgi:hypothetical protein